VGINVLKDGYPYLSTYKNIPNMKCIQEICFDEKNLMEANVILQHLNVIEFNSFTFYQILNKM
tara:strand:- start:908 stop:1096 length:189 start_codon:yes stop_codon:yes gene_type:complete